jgi:pheromone shutdown protein TraB
LFFKSFDKRYKQKFRFDIKQGVPSPEMIEELLELLKKDAPDLYRVLIHDRNVHMGQRLLRLHSQHEGLILAVVGAGHVSGMEKFLKHHLMANTVTYSTTVDAPNESF